MPISSPRPGGALAAVAACPDADVIFVAHAGLDNIITLGDVWGRFPINQVNRASWWRVPVDAVPRGLDHEGQVQWLYYGGADRHVDLGEPLAAIRSWRLPPYPRTRPRNGSGSYPRSRLGR